MLIPRNGVLCMLSLSFAINNRTQNMGSETGKEKAQFKTPTPVRYEIRGGEEEEENSISFFDIPITTAAAAADGLGA